MTNAEKESDRIKAIIKVIEAAIIKQIPDATVDEVFLALTVKLAGLIGVIPVPADRKDAAAHVKDCLRLALTRSREFEAADRSASAH